MTELKKYKMFIGGEWVDSDTKKTKSCKAVASRY